LGLAKTWDSDLGFSWITYCTYASRGVLCWI